MTFNSYTVEKGLTSQPTAKSIPVQTFESYQEAAELCARLKKVAGADWRVWVTAKPAHNER